MPIRLSETPARIERGAPTLGRHNGAVFGGVMGMDADTLGALEREGVI